MWNVPQPIRHLYFRLTANQVMALQVLERPPNSTQRTFLIMNFSLHKISASFSPSISCFSFPVLEKYVSLVIVFCLMPKKCFPSHCCLTAAVSLSVYPHPPSASLKWWEKSWSKNFCVCECCLVRQSQITRLWRVHMCLNVGAGTAIYIKEPRTSSTGAPSPP